MARSARQYTGVMRVVLQRVTFGSVTVDDQTVGQVDRGLVLLVGIAPGDDERVVARLAAKIVKLRVFPNEQGKFDRSLLDVGGGVLVVSQFTLFGDVRKGNRPSFTGAAAPDHAAGLCDQFVIELTRLGVEHVASGRFGQHMHVRIDNDGPVTLWLDSDQM